MKIHVLKTDPAVFEAVGTGKKTFEMRYNDRDFKVGDTLQLHETRHSGHEMTFEKKPLIYTTRVVERVISHIQEGYGLKDGWVLLSFEATPFRATEEVWKKRVEGITGHGSFSWGRSGGLLAQITHDHDWPEVLRIWMWVKAELEEKQKPLIPMLKKFLDASGGEGIELDGVDGGDLYMALFGAPEEEDAVSLPKNVILE